MPRGTLGSQEVELDTQLISQLQPHSPVWDEHARLHLIRKASFSHSGARCGCKIPEPAPPYPTGSMFRSMSKIGSAFLTGWEGLKANQLLSLFQARAGPVPCKTVKSGSLAFGLLHPLLSVHLSLLIPHHSPFGYSIAAAALLRFAQWKLAFHKLVLIYFQLK